MKKIYFFFQLLLSIPIIFFIYIIKPIKIIRIAAVNFERIGSIVVVDLCLSHYNTNKYLNVFTYNPNIKIANETYFKLIKRRVNAKKKYFFMYRAINYFNNKFNLFHSLTIKGQSFYYKKGWELSNKKKNFVLNSQDLKLAEKKLKQIGFNTKSKIVCIADRDAKFLKNFPSYAKEDMSRHNYRDVKIKNYRSIVRFLLKNKFTVVRVTKTSYSKLNFKNKNFFDLSEKKINKINAEGILEFYLASKCKFWINGNSGVTNLAKAYRKPILCLDHMNPGDAEPEFAWYKKVKYTTKKFYDFKNRIVSKKQLQKLNLLDGQNQDYLKNKIKIRDHKDLENYKYFRDFFNNYLKKNFFSRKHQYVNEFKKNNPFFK